MWYTRSSMRSNGTSSWRAPSLLLALCGLVACADSDAPDLAPPSVPRLPDVERTEVDAFRVVWGPSDSDGFAAGELRYDIGIVDRDYCVVIEPDLTLQGSAEVDVRLGPESDITGPLVAFTARAVDPDGRSYGYGGCGWALRSPQRVPIQVPWRRPRASRLACQGDGGSGAWCLGDAEVGYFHGGYWDIFTLPVSFEVADFLALDDNDALVRDERLQLHLSRATGVHAYLLSSGNQLFDGAGGAIPTGRERAYVSVRGAVGEFSSYHLDLAGPARALRLPDTCERVAQMGHVEGMAWALCDGEVGTELFLGEADRRTMRWAPARPVPIDRVHAVVGSTSAGFVVGERDETLQIVSWMGDEIETTALPVPGTGAIRAAATGSAVAPLLLAGRGGRFVAWRGQGPESVRAADGRFYWAGEPVDAESELVGTAQGILAITPERVVRLSAESAVVLQEPAGPVHARRGQDRRRYVFHEGDLLAVVSSVDGNDWQQQLWRGPRLALRDLAAAPNGAVYLSGLVEDPTSATGRRLTVRKLGEPDAELLPAGQEDFWEPPLLAVDELGRVFAVASSKIRWYTPATESWSDGLPLPMAVERIVGLESGVLVQGTLGDAPALVRCDGELCFPLTVPDAARHAVDSVIALRGGFCVGVRSRALWCREGQDDAWIEPRFTPESAERFGLGDADEWAIRDAVTTAEGGWLWAVETERGGLLVAIEEDESARVVASGLRWGAGEVLMAQPRTESAVAIELGGPARLRLRNDRISVPGSLY